MKARVVILAGLCTLLPGIAAAQTAPAGGVSAAGFQDSTDELAVNVGKSVLVDTAQPIARVAVGLGDIAVATAVNPTEVMVNGKTPGETSLIIWDVRGGRQFFNVSVRPSTAFRNSELEVIRQQLRQEMPKQPVRVSLDNGTVFLRGTVDDLTSADRAVKIASVGGKVVNLLDVRVPNSKPQILLKVRFVSVDRSLINSLGINFFNLGLGNAIGGITTGQFSPPFISSATGAQGNTGLVANGAQATFTNQLNLLAFFPGLKSGADIQALEQQNLLQVLAEPNLMAADGKEASFLAGGQYPYPVVQGTSAGGSTAVSIEFKDYGIRLNFIPTVTPRGTIRLQVAPEVSALDYSNEVQISGFVVPGITMRRVNTEVELKDRQSFVIGGLLDNTVTQTFEKIPFIGDIPILGKFFQSIQRTKANTELIVIVTPEIVAPIPAGQPLPDLKQPEAYMPANSKIPMHNPDQPPVPQEPEPSTVPVEKLLDSMKPEQPLLIDSGSSGGSGSGGGMGTSMSGGTSSPQP
jgi:pilus assembly protein CpaC